MRSQKTHLEQKRLTINNLIVEEKLKCFNDLKNYLISMHYNLGL